MSAPRTPPGENAAEGTPGVRLTGWRLAVTLALTGGLLYLLFTQVSFGEIVAMIRKADPGLFALGCTAYVISYFGRMARWRLLTPSQTVPWGAIYGVTAVHNFMLRALPSKLGETVYVLLMRARGVPGTEAVAALVVARIYDTAAAILFFLAAIVITGARLHTSMTANIVAGLTVIALCGLLILRGSLFIRLLHALAHRLAESPGTPRWLLGRGIRRRLAQLETHLATFQSLRHAPLLFFYTVAIWVPSYLMFYWLLQSFGTPYSFWGTVFASTLSTAATLLPVGTIGNFGTTEAGWTMGLMVLGATRAEALATGFSTHLVGVALAGLLGLIGLLFTGFALFRPRRD